VGYGRSYYPQWPENIINSLTPTQRCVLEPPYANRLDRPVIANEGQDIEVSSRSTLKKNFDQEVFGTKYF
jgi:hypothetical protein